MRLKVVIFKVSLNSYKIFHLRKTPDLLRQQVFDSINKKHDKTYEDNRISYSIQIVNSDRYSFPNIVLGRAIKYRKSSETEKWDDKTKDIIIEIDENNILEKVHFFYEKESELLIVEERSSFDLDKFREVFTHIINYNNIEVEVDINPKLHADEVKKRIANFKKINWAHFEIIPNNPEQKLWHIFEKINESIESTSSIHEFRNNDGIKYTNELQDMVDDVNEGRGRRYIFGGYDNENKYDEVRSHEHIKRYFKEVDPSDEGRIKGIWETMKNILDL